MGGRRTASGDDVARIRYGDSERMAPWGTRAAGIHEFVLQAFLRAGRNRDGPAVSAHERAGAVLEGKLGGQALGRAYAALGRLEHHLPHAPSFRGSDIAAASGSLAAATDAGLRPGAPEYPAASDGGRIPRGQ